MHRIPELTARFFHSRRALGSMTRAADPAVVATIRSLAKGPLPDKGDFETLTYPVGTAWVRRVPRFSLWLSYTFDDETVRVLDLATHEPTRVDPSSKPPGWEGGAMTTRALVAAVARLRSPHV